MKKLIPCLTILAAACLAPAQTVVTPPTSIETVISLDSTHSVSEVISQRVGILHDVGGIKGWALDFRAIGGLNLTDHNVPTGGFALVGYFQVAKEITLGLGPEVAFTQKNRPTVSIFARLLFNFAK